MWLECWHGSENKSQLNNKKKLVPPKKMAMGPDKYARGNDADSTK